MKIPPPDLRSAAVRPLTEDESKTLLMLTMHEMGGEASKKIFEDMHNDLQGFLGYRILDDRLNTFSLVQHLVERPIRILCSTFAKSPGEAVMWAWTLHRIAEEEKDPVTIGLWTQHFPMGIPTDEGLGLVWDSQKCLPALEHGIGPDNLLDYPQLWRGEIAELETVVKPNSHYEGAYEKLHPASAG